MLLFVGEVGLSGPGEGSSPVGMQRTLSRGLDRDLSHMNLRLNLTVKQHGARKFMWER